VGSHSYFISWIGIVYGNRSGNIVIAGSSAEDIVTQKVIDDHQG